MGVKTKQPDAHGAQSLAKESLFDQLVRINPFYLLSVAFVIHGSGYWFRASGGHEPWKLLALLGGFQLMLAITGVLVVRLGKVWDDARTIFILLLLITLELSISFDDTLLHQTGEGWLILMAGWVLTAVLYESVFLGLRMRVRAVLRLPFHVMIALLFLYPLLVLPAIRASDKAALQWQLAAFSLCVAAAILTLLPAVRAGRRCVEGSSTAWKWPALPWVPMSILGGCLIVRSYAICVSLDPALSVSVSVARQLGSIFSGVLLVPSILATGVLLMQASATHRSHRLWNISQCLPYLAVGMALLPVAPSVLQQQFQTSLTTTVASPLYITIISGIAYFIIGTAYRRAHADWGVLCFTVLLLISSPQEQLFVMPQLSVFPIAPLGLYHFVRGLKTRAAWQALLGVICLTVSVHDILVRDLSPAWAIGIELNVVLAAMVTIGAFLKHQLLLRFAMAIMLSLPIFAVLPDSSVLAAFTPSVRHGYCGTILIVSAMLAVRHRLFLWPAISAMLCLTGIAVRHLWDALRQIQGWQGLAFYLGGLIWFVIAVFASRQKAIRLSQQRRQ